MARRDTILLVDDVPANLNALSRVLADEYELSIATTGATALTLAREHRPDLILLDVMMPDMDGLETLARLRSNAWGRDVPVILVTADDRAETQVRGLELGADDFLHKPILLPALLARVRSQLQRKRLREALQSSEARYRQLSEEAPVCVSAFLPDGTLTYVNQRTADLAGQPVESIIGRSFFDWLPAGQRETVSCALAALTPEDPFESHEQRHRAADGSRRVFHWTNTAFFDDSCRPVRYQAIGIDVTERRLIEELLAALNGELARLSGRDFFSGVCRLLTRTLDTDIAFVGRIDDDESSVSVTDGWGDGQPLTPFAYGLAGSPCAEVLSGSIACYPRDVKSLFPMDVALSDKGIESYVGATLFDRRGRALGIVATLGRKPLSAGMTSLSPSLIKLLVDRIASEMLRLEAERNTQRQLAFQRLAAAISTELASAGGDAAFDTAIDGCLQSLGELLAADRCYLLQLSDDLSRVSSTHEWCERKVSVKKDRLQDIPLASLPRLRAALLKDGLIHVPKVAELPAEAAAEKAECIAQEIQSLVMVATRDARGLLSGAIACDSVRGARIWSEEETTMLQTMAGIIGNTLEQRRAAQALDRQSRYRELIQQLSLSFINLPLEALDAAIDDALERIGRFFEVDRAYLFDYDFVAGTTSNTHEWCAPGITRKIANLQKLPIDVIPEWLAQHRRGDALLIEDLRTMPPGTLRDILEPQQVVSVITVPLMRGGDCMGYVGVDIVRQPANRIGPAERDLLRLFAELLVSVDKRKGTDGALRQAASVFEHANEGIMITAPDGTILDVNKAFTEITGYRREEALGRNPRILQSGRHDAAFYAGMWQSLEREGSWTGEVWNHRRNGELYAELLTISAVRDSDQRVQRYVALFSDITAQKAHERQLEHIAHYDALTGLPNRVLLADRMQQAMVQTTRRAEQIAVAYLDLDGFKAINDSHGHETGDQLLVTVAERMREALRRDDTIARLGGDEFVAVLGSLQGLETCEPLLRRLLAAAAEPVRIGDEILQVSASLGVSLYPQQDPLDADQLLRQADQAMYHAKLAGKNRYHFFDLEHDRTLRGRHESLERIRLALTRDEFVLHYQPKVNMRRGTIVGAEALIRWQHPERGLLSPAAFLPALENQALMVDLGDWVIDSTLGQIRAWRAAGLRLPVSVNVDPMQLDQPDFVTKLRDAMNRHPDLETGDLELEVVETSALEDVLHISRIIDACQAMGVSFALDDFGTGYSSLTYLKRLPVGVLKIDQSFVRDMLDDPDDLAILQGVIGLANAFRRSVIAEGVESEAHGERLLQLGCELGQGYAIARPMAAAEIPGWIGRWSPHRSWVQ